MTVEQLLAEISEKLSQVLTRLDRGAAWLTTPAGEFGILARISFGEMLLALLAIGFIGIKLIHLVYDTVASRGWW